MLDQALGRHVLAELFGCEIDLLNDVDAIRKAMVAAAKSAGAEVVGEFFHQFSPHGVSGVVVISESHLAVHTWPEHCYVAADVFTCGAAVDPWIACKDLVRAFGATNVTATEVRRGIFGLDRSRTRVVVAT